MVGGPKLRLVGQVSQHSLNYLAPTPSTGPTGHNFSGLLQANRVKSHGHGAYPGTQTDSLQKNSRFLEIPDFGNFRFLGISSFWEFPVLRIPDFGNSRFWEFPVFENFRFLRIPGFGNSR